MPGVAEARGKLRDVFGFDEFRDGQERVIKALLEGRSALAVFPTGGGKSLCYQIPALLLDGLTLVVSPLIALMKDQVDFLVGRGVAAARLDSSLELSEVRRIFDDLRNERLKLLYVAPERLAGERLLQTLTRHPIAMIAVDEAHCISEWGHNFRPEYLKLAGLAERLEAGRTLALTATATPDVARDVARGFGIAPEDVIITGFHRPNLEVHATPCLPAERREKLVDRLRSGNPGSAIVYVTLQRTAEELAAFLAESGFDARAYHAGLDDSVRHSVQDWFMASETGIVAATIAFGMGIDKPNIRSIYHYNLPKGLENYAQEIGRAGRDGLPARCELFACEEDVITLENFTFGDTPTSEAITGLLRKILGLGPVFDVSVFDLSRTHDARTLVVDTLLTYLELEGVIEATGPFYESYKFQPLRPSSEMLAQFDEARAEFLRRLFKQAKKGRTWFSLNISEAAENLGESRERIVAAFGFLEEQGDMLIQVSDVRRGYRLRQVQPDIAGLGRIMSERFLVRETRDVSRVRQMLAYAMSRGCLTRQLLAYFGDTLPTDCGHCGHCLGQAPPQLIPQPARALGADDQALAVRVRNERHAALASPRQLARFLCGLSSPASTRARLSRHPSFGAFAEVPFAGVLAFTEKAFGAEL